MKHFNIKIFGKVQMVFFRISAKEKADELGIFGIRYINVVLKHPFFVKI